jgi:plasmid stabilization system protein ParE
MPTLIYTFSAQRSLVKLRAFIAQHNPSAAHRASQAILQGASQLKQYPHLGHPVAELPAEFRDLVIPFGNSGYVMRYRYIEAENRVYVLAIRHQREAGFTTP